MHAPKNIHVLTKERPTHEMLFFPSNKARTCGGEDGGLELVGEHFRGSSHPLHHRGENLADHPVHIPDVGSRRGGRGRLGGRAERVRLQHGSAGMQERLLRPGVPDIAHTLLGAPDHFRVVAFVGLHGTRSVPTEDFGEGEAQEKNPAAGRAGRDGVTVGGLQEVGEGT